ncbi:MAG: P1 family peptidase [Candidatus Korarchaeota archaeon]|nr:P1 family peptidase [Candidatus Korarchaeota archaeon]NIU83333.1 S58 family peptidase [Candidatus Thorarchaeota archaeon]NIW13664.1 S58 family peptidase [Candidatus Thorarchaeota archaeon]NIW51763.1 S58 family peptidase [Candidatus Korarchaeota archaeon]
MKRPRARDVGIKLGELPTGKDNALTDVPSVKIGHTSLIKEVNDVKATKAIRTGVTAILPHDRNLYQHKVRAAVHIINGYGKSVGLPQIRELGEIETPIMLTNTLNVWRVADALVSYMIETTEDNIRSINPVVGECNDGYLNDIQGRHVTEAHVRHAIDSATKDTREGTIGAGVGMSAFGLKGGIGMASRRILEGEYHLGVLVLSNFGRLDNLRICVPVGKQLKEAMHTEGASTDGSIMIIVGTNAPVSYRQLTRILNRVPHGLARTGSVSHHESGDFAIGFVSDPEGKGQIDENDLSTFFQATVESVEEAVINSILRAETVIGRKNHKREAISIETLTDILRDHRLLDEKSRHDRSF